MIKLTNENTQNAVAKCKQLKPRVKFIKDRLFVVYSANNSNVYHVSFDVQERRKVRTMRMQSQRTRLGLLSHRRRRNGKHLPTIFETCQIKTKGLPKPQSLGKPL